MTQGTVGPSPSGDGPRVAFFSAGWGDGPTITLGGSDWWRLAMPAAQLFANGWDVMFARQIAAGDDGRLQVKDPTGTWHGDRDLIVWQRAMYEHGGERTSAAREAGQIVVQDVDDHYWAIPEGHYGHDFFGGEGPSEFNERNYREAIERSSQVTVSTDYLADELKDAGPPLRTILNYIDLDSWPEPTEPGEMVGWVGGTPWRGKDLEILRETVVPWLRDRGRFFYHGGHLVGAKTVRDSLGYDRVSVRPACGVDRYTSLWEPLRVCLIPIDSTPFGLSKSWAKGLEACARGIPFIVSDHPEYRKLGVGRIVERPEDWVRHLEELEDPQVYAEECARNRARAEELSIQRHWGEWADLFRELVPATRAKVKRAKPGPRLPHPQQIEVELRPELQARIDRAASSRLIEEQKFVVHWIASMWDGRGNVFSGCRDFREAIQIGVETNPNEKTDGTKTRGTTYSLAVVDGGDSWAKGRQNLEVLSRMSEGGSLVIAGFTDPEKFWLPVMARLLGEHLAFAGYCVSTYALRVLSDRPNAAGLIPSSPSEIDRARYDEIFDHLAAHAAHRDDEGGTVALAAQRAAAYAAIGLADEAEQILDDMLNKVAYLPFRPYLLHARDGLAVAA